MNKMITMLQLVLFAFGVKELYSAIKYRKQGNRNWAIASLYMGIIACACALISFTGII